ncbi:MAG TPA: beta-eliminating lyase-related protein, partial [Candidatus Acidoferrales bacterium]
SMLVGSGEFIHKAHRYRKTFGGGMRQVGVLAAAGLVALEESPKRLHEDHANARHLAEGLAQIPGISLDVGKVVTNIVRFDVRGTGRTAADICAALKQRHVLAGPFAAYAIRMVTHCDVDRAAINHALEVMRAVIAS